MTYKRNRISNEIYHKTFAFTGKLCILRREAIQAVIDSGGYSLSNNVTMKTDYLVQGTPKYTRNKTKKEVRTVSNKRKKAESMIIKGHPIQIISEEEFFELLRVYQYRLAI